MVLIIYSPNGGDMPKRYVTVGDELDEIFQKEADRRGAPYALLVRQAMEEWAQKRGHKVEDTVTWGGPRKTGEEEPDEGQTVAVAAC
jgi:hypothetical protein